MLRMLVGWHDDRGMCVKATEGKAVKARNLVRGFRGFLFKTIKPGTFVLLSSDWMKLLEKLA
jgi:hypothetical protein